MFTNRTKNNPIHVPTNNSENSLPLNLAPSSASIYEIKKKKSYIVVVKCTVEPKYLPGFHIITLLTNCYGHNNTIYYRPLWYYNTDEIAPLNLNFQNKQIEPFEHLFSKQINISTIQSNICLGSKAQPYFDSRQIFIIVIAIKGAEPLPLPMYWCVLELSFQFEQSC